MKQTPVEWLWNMLLKGEFINDPEELLRQAKEMEKEQIIDTWNNAINAVEKDKWESFEQYYNETFKSE
jgi:hypothetical protein